jgi:transcriptional regulator with XRE-family HTH domain
MTLGERIRLLRDRAGLTRYQVANRARIQASHYGKIESGRVRNPGWQTVQGLAQALGITPNDLADNAPPPC